MDTRAQKKSTRRSESVPPRGSESERVRSPDPDKRVKLDNPALTSSKSSIGAGGTGSSPIAAFRKVYQMGKSNAIVHVDEMYLLRDELQAEIKLHKDFFSSELKDVRATIKELFQPMQTLVEQTVIAAEDLRIQMEKKAEENATSLRGHFEEKIREAKEESDSLQRLATKEALDVVQRIERLENMSAVIQSIRADLLHGQAQLDSLNGTLETLSSKKDVGEQDSKLTQLRARSEEFETSAKSALASHAGELERIRSEYACAHHLDEIRRDIVTISNTLEHNHGRHQEHFVQLGDVSMQLRQQVADQEVKLELELQRLQDNLKWCSGSQVDDGLRRMVTKSASATVRSVEWLVPEAAKPSSEVRYLLSPTFEAAGEAGLQLELKIMPAGATCHAPEDMPVSLGSAAGTCCVSLLAEGGAHLYFRFSVGHFTGPEQEHRFNRWEPCAAGHVWSLADHVGEEDGSLRIVVEFLEARRTLKLNTDDLPQSFGTIVRHHHLYQVSHLLPHLLEDIRRTGEDRFRPRGVRRVEWHLKQASTLQKLYPKGQCICSNAFTAAGVYGLQMLFYPQGCERAPPGYCSCFVKLRPGDYIPGVWLRVGSHRWEAEWLDDTPGFIGCTRFWLAEQCVDASSDTLLLTLELQAASDDVVCVGTLGDPDVAAGSRPLSARGGQAALRANPGSRPSSAISPWLPPSASNAPRPPAPRCKSASRRKRRDGDSALVTSAGTNEWKTQGYANAAAALAPRKVPPTSLQVMI